MLSFAYQNVPMDQCTDSYSVRVCLEMLRSSRLPPWMALIPLAAVLTVAALSWMSSILWGPDWLTDLSRQYYSRAERRQRRPPGLLRLSGGSFVLARPDDSGANTLVQQAVSANGQIARCGICPRIGQNSEVKTVPGGDDMSARPLRGHVCGICVPLTYWSVGGVGSDGDSGA